MMEAMSGRALNNQRPLTAGMTIGVMTSALCRWVYGNFFVKNVLPSERSYTLICFFLGNGLQQPSERPGPTKGDLTHNAHCTLCGLSEVTNLCRWYLCGATYSTTTGEFLE